MVFEVPHAHARVHLGLQVYRYCRGLLSEEPAPVAKDNLLQVLEKYRVFYCSQENSPPVKVRVCVCGHLY